MPNTIEKLPNEPIVVFKMAEGHYTSAAPDPDTARKSIALLEAQPEPVFYVVDLFAATFDFQAMLENANNATRGLNAALRHPKIRQAIMLSKDPAIQMAAKGLNSEAFGYLQVPVLGSMDEALAYIHEQIGR